MKKILSWAMLPLLFCATSSAHTLLIKPNTQGPAFSADVMMTETFFQGERRLDPLNITSQLISEHGVKWLHLADEHGQSKVLHYVLPKRQQGGIIATTAKPRYRGIKKGQPASSPENTLRIDDFAKTILPDTRSEMALLSGQAFEIVPLVNPDTVPPKGTLALQALFNGEPIQVAIKVVPEIGEAVRLTTDEKGQFEIVLDKPGLWVIKAVHKREEGYDAFSGAYEAAASLLFQR